MSASPLVSVIVPVLGDTASLRRALDAVFGTLQGPAGQAVPAGSRHASPTASDAAPEVIVSGVPGEVEALAEMCRMYPGARAVESPPGRSRQMNAGARHATGRWLLFLHADSRLHPGWLTEIARADAMPGCSFGCFRFALDDASRAARIVEFGVRQRVRLARLPYGDQGIFVRRAVFDRIGGYADLPIMEDVDLVDRLHRTGRLLASDIPVITSARRWHRDGWFRRSATNAALIAFYRAGASPQWLARVYARRPPNAVIVLARAPSTGGKSRLWAEFDGRPDEDLLRALLLDTVEAAAGLDATDIVLASTPSSALAEMSALVPRARIIAQRGHDLGARMHAAFEDVCLLGYRAVVLIGSDLPTLPGEVLRSALRRLARGSDVVLGPSEDGGYFLVGLRRPDPRVFADIEWSRPDVLERTRRAAAAAGLRVGLVAPWYDVDDVASLRRAAADAERAPRVRAWVTRRL
jgi:rSAM/selenodomain-associated transferase 2/rSAM/selenodomain-associated transferase 1